MAVYSMSPTLATYGLMNSARPTRTRTFDSIALLAPVDTCCVSGFDDSGAKFEGLEMVGEVPGATGGATGKIKVSLLALLYIRLAWTYYKCCRRGWRRNQSL